MRRLYSKKWAGAGEGYKHRDTFAYHRLMRRTKEFYAAKYNEMKTRAKYGDAEALEWLKLHTLRAGSNLSNGRNRPPVTKIKLKFLEDQT